MAKRPTPSVSHDDDNDDNGNEGSVTVRKIDPLIRSLLTHLPKPGDVWASAARDNWMTLLEGAFKVIYKEAEQKPAGAPDAKPAPGTVRTP